ncbi:MAG: glycosyltransferase [Silicimonas sp.]|nr:glycosyltransferase [Silicimonas sp.]
MNVSVIVVSLHRRPWLARCLLALRQLDYPAFEIIVVADGESLAQMDTTGLKTLVFDTANIAQARNHGIALAGGEICAFIDDDAVPEPLWLRHLVAAFEATAADGVVGHVRGRNGISFQSRAASVDRDGITWAEPGRGDAPFVPELAPGRALKLVGTNMALRRPALVALGGFDPTFRYYLDDTDLSLRLAQSGRRAAVAPLAEVHHGFAPSLRRSATRTPLDLTDIGRSTALFLRRHGGADPSGQWEALYDRERARLLRHMVIGNLTPGDVGRRLETLARGWREGLDAPLGEGVRDLALSADFSPVLPMITGQRVIRSRLFRRRSALKKASELSSKGHRVTLLSFSLTPVRHHLLFTNKGVWFQRGGQFGRSERETKRIRWCRFAQRCEEEIARVAKVRGI